MDIEDLSLDLRKLTDKEAASICGGMKKIEAIIRPFKLDEVKISTIRRWEKRQAEPTMSSIALDTDLLTSATINGRVDQGLGGNGDEEIFAGRPMNQVIAEALS